MWQRKAVIYLFILHGTIKINRKNLILFGICIKYFISLQWKFKIVRSRSHRHHSLSYLQTTSRSLVHCKIVRRWECQFVSLCVWVDQVIRIYLMESGIMYVDVFISQFILFGWWWRRKNEIRNELHCSKDECGSCALFNFAK